MRFLSLVLTTFWIFCQYQLPSLLKPAILQDQQRAAVKSMDPKKISKEPSFRSQRDYDLSTSLIRMELRWFCNSVRIAVRSTETGTNFTSGQMIRLPYDLPNERWLMILEQRPHREDLRISLRWNENARVSIKWRVLFTLFIANKH